MKRIAKFHKVSPEQFAKDWKDTFPAADDKEIQDTYEKISLPVRATAGSAGYDFFAPADIVLNPGETAKIPTGVRVEMEQDWVLKCYPRSGLGFKFRLQLNNTVGIIDSDYFYRSSPTCSGPAHILRRWTGLWPRPAHKGSDRSVQETES